MTTEEKIKAMRAKCKGINQWCDDCPLYDEDGCEFEVYDKARIDRLYSIMFPNDSTDAQTPRECKSCESFEVLVHTLREENEILRGEILDLKDTIVQLCKRVYGRH